MNCAICDLRRGQRYNSLTAQKDKYICSKCFLSGHLVERANKSVFLCACTTEYPESPYITLDIRFRRK